MDMDWIPVKTEAGVMEIATRAGGLPPRLRTVLILANGRRNAAALAEAAVGFGDIPAALYTLLEKGLIAASGTHPVRVPEPASRAAERVSSETARIVEEVLIMACRV